MRLRHRQVLGFAITLWLIFFQSMTAIAMPAYSTQLDAFGNPLCISNRVADKEPAHGKTAPLDCCLTGCCAAIAAAAAVPDLFSRAVEFPREPNRLVVAQVTLPAMPDRHDPGRPRGPPSSR